MCLKEAWLDRFLDIFKRGWVGLRKNAPNLHAALDPGWSRDQCRWGAVVVAAVLVFQLVRLAWVQSQAPEVTGPAHQCTKLVQVGGIDGTVVCLDSGFAALRGHGVSGCCIEKLRSEKIESGDAIQCIAVDGDGAASKGCGLQIGRMVPARLATLGVVLDVNSATAKELSSIKGVGPALARRIVARRESSGQFDHVEGLLSVRGIGPKMLARIRARLKVGSR
jgi:competence ComEA-like helix-hairpin-helix protein